MNSEGMKTESGNRTESENRILAENVFCENYRKCSDGQKVRRGAEGQENGMVEWIGNGIDGRVSKVFWRAEGEEKESRMKTESGNRTEPGK